MSCCIFYCLCFIGNVVLKLLPGNV